ncbi:molybdopterin molybdotransferase [Nitrobacteraceae bacterium AZCC 2146]
MANTASALDCDDGSKGDAKRPRPLLSLNDAIDIASSFSRAVERTEVIPLAEVNGRELSCDVAAHHDLPLFDQSAMDGYALSGDAETYELSPLAGTRAGDRPGFVYPGQAMKIATGGFMPAGADRVALQEHTVQRNGKLIVKGPLERGSNIRLRGEDVQKDDSILPKGSRLDPQKIALLAAQGVGRVEVRGRPRVAVISSGDELRQPGDVLRAGNIYDSNRPMLLALAEKAGAAVTDAGCVADDVQAVANAIARLSQSNDFVLLSGGSSHGDADMTRAALLCAGAAAEELKIAIKPGKPAVVGRLGGASVLGVPGNPFAAFVSWLTLGRSMLGIMLGIPSELLSRARKLPVSNTLQRRPGRTEFVPARIVWDESEERLEFLGRGGSARLLPLSRADGLAWVEADRGSVQAGERVRFIPF